MAKAEFIQPDPFQWLEKFYFRIPIKIRFCETDMLGHLNNVTYFIYFEQGRIDYIEHVGVTEELFNMEKGYSIVTADLECHFLSQVYYEQNVSLLVRTSRLGRSSLDLEYALVLTESNQLAAAGRGTLVLIDKESGKSIPIPEETKQQIKQFERGNLD